MAKRISKETKRQYKEIEWEYIRDYYAGNYKCTKCGIVKYTRGKRKDTLKCKECFING